MKNDQIKTIAFMAIYMALYVALKMVGNMIPFLQMPNGGSIELELIPLMIASYHLGWKYGVLCGLASFLLTIVLGFPMYFVQPIQILLSLIGLSACAAVYYSYGMNLMALVAGIVLAALVIALGLFLTSTKGHFGIVIVMIIKYFSTVISGAYFWAEGTAAGSLPAWTFSLGYNLWYNLVTMIVCLLMVPVLMSRIKKANIQGM